MSVTVSVTIIDLQGFPSPAINPPEDPPLLLEDLYEGSTVSFNVRFQAYEIIGETASEVDTLINLYSYDTDVSGFIAKKSSNTIVNISGTPTKVFTDAFYEVLNRQKSLQVVSADNVGDFLSLIKWSTPSTKIKDFYHNLTVNVITDKGNIDYANSFPQSVYWRADVASAAFLELVSRSEI
jgi:hypothetical protein